MIVKLNWAIFSIIVSGLLISGWFWWYQYRPAKIRKACYELIQKDYDEMLKGDRILVRDKITNQPGTIPNTELEIYKSRYEFIPPESDFGKNQKYINCLVSMGIKPESLIK